MPPATKLEKQWDELMLLCEREKEYLNNQSRGVFAKVLARRIEELAGEMGFNEAQITGRNFRAEKTDGRITSLITND